MVNSVAIVLLTWKRLNMLNQTLQALANQTYKNFVLHISHSDDETFEELKKIIASYKDRLTITYSLDSNDRFCFRRYDYAKQFANSGVEIVFFLDDDLIIPNNHIELGINQYKPKTYQSSWAFKFLDSPPKYNNRKKIQEKGIDLDHCGPGMSMIDSSLFLNDDFFNNDLIIDNYQFDDIWISYFVKNFGWDLEYLESTIQLKPLDNVAMYPNLMKDKEVFARKLYDAGWNIKPIED
jgi:glycosyltransferase involved in cell wall biosynthesis